MIHVTFTWRAKDPNQNTNKCQLVAHNDIKVYIHKFKLNFCTLEQSSCKITHTILCHIVFWLAMNRFTVLYCTELLSEYILQKIVGRVNCPFIENFKHSKLKHTSVMTEKVIICDWTRFCKGVELVDPLFGDKELEKRALYLFCDLLRLLSYWNHVVILLSEEDYWKDESIPEQINKSISTHRINSYAGLGPNTEVFTFKSI